MTVELVVSMIQPRTSLRVAQVPSPLRNVLTEAGSCQCMLSLGPSGRRTLSSA